MEGLHASKNEITPLRENFSTSSSTANISIGEVIQEMDPTDRSSVPYVLNFCKRKVLHPYLRLLGVMGLRSLTIDSPESSTCLMLLSYLYTFQVIAFTVVGYVLQYMSCFRRDRGLLSQVEFPQDHEEVYDSICHRSGLYTFVIPDLMHIMAYFYSLYLFRNNEHLANLMERVFLSSCNPSDGTAGQRKLVRTLRWFIAASILWIALSFAAVNVFLADGTIIFKWMNHMSPKILAAMKILLTVCTLWHDMIQATILTCYCIQAQLLIYHASFLRANLVQNSVQSLDFMRDLLEFKSLLKYLNNRLGAAVCSFLVLDISWICSGIMLLLKYDSHETTNLFYLNLIALSLWICIVTFPIVQAARLTSACKLLQGIGHHVRIRPFPHQETSAQELDSILIFSSSIRLNAKLFGIPINVKYLIFTATVGLMLLLAFGQCHFLQD